MNRQGVEASTRLKKISCPKAFLLQPSDIANSDAKIYCISRCTKNVYSVTINCFKPFGKRRTSKFTDLPPAPALSLYGCKEGMDSPCYQLNSVLDWLKHAGTLPHLLNLRNIFMAQAHFRILFTFKHFGDWSGFPNAYNVDGINLESQTDEHGLIDSSARDTLF